MRTSTCLAPWRRQRQPATRGHSGAPSPGNLLPAFSQASRHRRETSWTKRPYSKKPLQSRILSSTAPPTSLVEVQEATDLGKESKIVALIANREAVSCNRGCRGRKCNSHSGRNRNHNTARQNLLDKCPNFFDTYLNLLGTYLNMLYTFLHFLVTSCNLLDTYRDLLDSCINLYLLETCRCVLHTSHSLLDTFRNLMDPCQHVSIKL